MAKAKKKTHQGKTVLKSLGQCSFTRNGDPSAIEKWRRQYPEAFQREYTAASGLRFNGWIEEEK